ncbi:metalloregulator ArsR/SmtB family transcription factor [Aeromicrobium sp. IC_218]|uniref:ArsR/SmtB family transcription factor n=1 Tax=Aeromicrobium sp. IC_218 TaxID=2545468 RepID=UPI00103CA825|nr:metalloregulator ArsR/SmtB family transcription factor [Aeromicrobium sp. IC_218]TCI99149.1 ArsR family transcriptional regulator [Aeromicrobium sp. IC_218]
MLNHQEDLDSVFRALGDGTRRAIVARLSRSAATVSELAAPFEMSLPAVLQHLKVLEAAGLVASQKVGRVRTFRVVPGALEDAGRWIADVRTPAERLLDRLEAHLDEHAPPPPEESS